MELKDYAYPTIRAEKCLKDLHDAVLDKKWDRAQERSVELMGWVKEIQDALDEMRKNEE